MKIFYDEVLVGEVITNRSMTVEEALATIQFDEKDFLDEQGWDDIDYDNFRLDYSGN